MKRYIIEREIPGIGNMSTVELCGAARASNQALLELAQKVQWQHSYVAANKTYCVYLADSEESIKACRTQRLSGQCNNRGCDCHRPSYSKQLNISPRISSLT